MASADGPATGSTSSESLSIRTASGSSTGFGGGLAGCVGFSIATPMRLSTPNVQRKAVSKLNGPTIACRSPPCALGLVRSPLGLV